MHLTVGAVGKPVRYVCGSEEVSTSVIEFEGGGRAFEGCECLRERVCCKVIAHTGTCSGSGVSNVISYSSKLFQITLLLDGTIILCKLLR